MRSVVGVWGGGGVEDLSNCTFGEAWRGGGGGGGVEDLSKCTFGVLLEDCFNEVSM